MEKKKVLILGSTGMLGYTLFSYFKQQEKIDVYGTVRNTNDVKNFFSSEDLHTRIISGVDANDYEAFLRVFASVRPDIVINCIGLIKQSSLAYDPLFAIPVNALFPHKIALMCKMIGARMIHISTDCVFNGEKGNYIETDASDAEDLYGQTKYLGEVKSEHCITLRTSIIGHELKTKHSLIEWFLSQEGSVNGYTKAIFSGFPTVELARIINDYVIPNETLHGLYHVSAEPISKKRLLQIVRETYNKDIKITPSEDVTIDRTLLSSRFRMSTGYIPPVWEELVAAMYNQYITMFK